MRLHQFALLKVGTTNNEANAAWIYFRQSRFIPGFLQHSKRGLGRERGGSQGLPGYLRRKNGVTDFIADISRFTLTARPLHDLKGGLTLEQRSCKRSLALPDGRDDPHPGDDRFMRHLFSAEINRPIRRCSWDRTVPHVKA